MIGLSRRLLHLLTQKIKRRNPFSMDVISINMDIIADGVCRPKRINAARHKEIFRYDLFKKLLRIIEKLAGLFTDLWVVENRRVTAAQLPRMEKRRPIDVGNKITQRDCDFLG